MYQFSRAIYRELAPLMEQAERPGQDDHAELLRACEQTMERLAGDRHYFARPARTLFNDIRALFPMTVQHRVWRIVSSYVQMAEQWVANQPRNGLDANGNPLQCRATTRRGTACQRMPLPSNGYCPSHQHLADTEEMSDPAVAAA